MQVASVPCLVLVDLHCKVEMWKVLDRVICVFYFITFVMPIDLRLAWNANDIWSICILNTTIIKGDSRIMADDPRLASLGTHVAYVDLS